MKLVVGLGNPGKKYVRTRHNIGAMVVRHIAEQLQMPLNQRRFKGMWAAGQEGRQKLFLLLPRTYMNLSGTAVKPATDFYDVPIDHVVVVHDDLDLPFGRIRVKMGGGAGGHNGISSVIEQTGSPDFIRVRVGIGHPGRKDDVTNYVLQPFNREERDQLPRVLDEAATATMLAVRRGAEAAMNEINVRERPALVAPVRAAVLPVTDDKVLEPLPRRGLA